MENFDFARILKQHEKKHKQKPAQFASVASGVQKRMESKLKSRKSNRFSIFDSIRNLSRSASPAPVSEAQQKLANRLQQLERWKEEKEKNRKEAAAKKKKPFLAGLPHTSLKYVPPPPPPTKPSTSGRVTRSQTSRNTKSEKVLSKSFAPKNATFKPPELKNNSKIPFVSLVPLKLAKSNVTFDPVLPMKKDKPVAVNEVRSSRSRTQNKQIDTKVVKKKADEDKKNAKNNKTIFRPTSKTFQSSSSSKTDSSMPLQKTFQSSSSSETDSSMPLQKTFQSSSSSKTDSSMPLQKTFQSSSSSETDSSMPLHKTFQGSSSSDTDSSVCLQKNIQSSSSSETDESMSLAPRDRKPMPIIQLQSTKNESESTPVISNTKNKSLNQRRTRQSLQNPDSPILISKTPRKSTLSALDQITPKNQGPKSESSSEQRLRPSKSPLNMERTPEQIIEEAKRISPCVTMSRGKDNARREMKKKLDEGLLDEDTTDVNNVEHFRRQLASEIKRMTEMCEMWDKVQEQAELPESIQERILASVGQCRLLMTKKLQQFASLVERCARPDPSMPLVTPADLCGFWDMVYMQIENVDIRFKKLEELRARNWTEGEVVAVAKKKAGKAVKAKPTGGASRIKEMIAAARKAKKEQVLAAPAASPGESKSFEAGFFCVTSPIRSPAPATPRSKLPTLLKAVLSSEAKKSASMNAASFAMLRASVLGKNADYEGISPLPLTPSPKVMNATPGRSILKKAAASSKTASTKSIKVVLFDQSVTESDTLLDDDEPTTDLTTSSKNQPIVDLEKPMGNIDVGVSSMEIEKEEKENVRRTPRLTRQCAVEVPHHIPMMTRSRRKSSAIPQETKTPQGKNKTPQKNKDEDLQENKTPQTQTKGRRSARKAKVLVDVLNDL